ncbi:MAG: DCC1-like thiol-disulfide oxidoreductase family protein [Methylococcales bacterium]|nr:DCC1-like thiol-disulfide oxidoreductase family protein [Methylococcales bacterium]
MYSYLSTKFFTLLNKQVPATGLGLFRIGYGLIALQEICFLLYFNHLIFDPIPYLDVEFPMIPAFLGLWAIVAACVTLGYRYQTTMLLNYALWILFVNFTPMQRDFDGGFDTFMIGAGFFLLFMPADRAFSLDNLRYKLSNPFKHYSYYQKQTVTALAYLIPVAICLGFLYFDSAVHKMFAPHWRNGLGTWLPATQPYYVSALDFSFLLNQKWFENAFSYTILVFQFTFPFFFWHRRARIVYLLIGMSLHLGITLSFNIYPFGLGMLCFYLLMIPFAWWRAIGNFVVAKEPVLTVFYDKECPLCNRTVLILNHFDIFKRIDFKNAQDNAANNSAISSIGLETLLTDLYAVDKKGNVYAGVQTYAQILQKMGYLKPIGVLLALPIIRTIAEKKYRAIADNRVRCDVNCLVAKPLENTTWYTKLFEQSFSKKPKSFTRKFIKILSLFLILQLNSTIHFGLIYRFKLHNPLLTPLAQASDAIVLWSTTFVGIVPHALYLHDHFSGYDHILAITYTDESGQEKWLPFVNEQGRLLAPNWGRVHSMWANIAVTPNIDTWRLKKLMTKVIAFYGLNLGLDLNKTTFHIQMKKINAPDVWEQDLLHKNLAGAWSIIGTARWMNKSVQIDLPDDINVL